jgi:hypothetical protein
MHLEREHVCFALSLYAHSVLSPAESLSRKSRTITSGDRNQFGLYALQNQIHNLTPSEKLKMCFIISA